MSKGLVYDNFLSLKNIQNIKANFKYIFNGYNTFYIIDTYDIIEYCFPYIFSSSASFDKDSAISDYLSYQYLFFGSPQKPIILDEYKVELFSFWYKLDDKVKEYSNYNNIKNDLISKYVKLNNALDKVEFIESNFPILLALAFGTLSKTPIERYNNLISKRLQIEHFETKDKYDQEIIEEIFYQTKPRVEVVDKIFDDFCDSVGLYLLGKEPEETLLYLENSLRDIKVFHRLVQINEKLNSNDIQRHLNEKYNFLFLSSTPYKSSLIQRHFNSYISKNSSISTNLHRTNIETYLTQLLNLGLSEKSETSIIKALESLTKITTNLKDITQILENDELCGQDFREFFAEEWKYAERELETSLLKYSIISNFNIRIKNALDHVKKSDDDKKLLALLDEVLNLIPDRKGTLLEIENSLEKHRLNFKYQKDILSNLKSLHSKSAEIKIQIFPGKDEVRSLVQSFPVLLFFKKNIREIEDFFLNIITPSYDKEEFIQKYIKLSPRYLHKLNSAERKLYFLFMRYLLLGANQQGEENLLREIDDLRSINAKRKMVSSKDSNGYLKVSFSEDIEFSKEIYYFKTWILRRLNKHDEALEVLNELIEDEGIDDVRLLHSRALCYKNKYYSEINFLGVKRLIHTLTKALRDFKQCEIMYESILLEKEFNKIILQVLIATSNSIVDTYAQLFLLDNEAYKESILNECRKRLDEFKSKVNEFGYRFELYPAYNHTEVDLLYCESFIAYRDNDSYVAKQKIEQAYNLVHKIDKEKLLMNLESFHASKFRVERLARRIL